MAARPLLVLALLPVVACGGAVSGGGDAGRDAGAGTDASGGGIDGGPAGGGDGSVPSDGAPSPDTGAPDAGFDAGPTGPTVDRTDPQLHSFDFRADEADPEASVKLATQLAFLDTRVEPVGKLVVYLHGAGAPSTCGSGAHGEVLAGMGFHVLSPCYVSDYGIGNCGDDIGGCRLEAFEGVDHHDFIDIAPPDAIERRVVRGLQHLQTMHPGGDWEYFVDGEAPRWRDIVISGISHGASTSGVVGMNRLVHRVVMLSGPLDRDQAWLLGTPLTPIDRFFGFTHTGDSQHPGHLEAFEDLGLPGDPAVVDGAAAPYGDSHRLVTSASTSNGHSAVQAGGASPTEGGEYVYLPVWQYMYGP